MAHRVDVAPAVATMAHVCAEELLRTAIMRFGVRLETVVLVRHPGQGGVLIVGQTLRESMDIKDMLEQAYMRVLETPPDVDQPA